MQETFGCGFVPPPKQNDDAQGFEYDNTESSNLVHDSSSCHPSFTKFMTGQYTPLNPNHNNDQDSDVDDDDETDSDNDDMDLDNDPSK
jgi:hypothetical protein